MHTNQTKNIDTDIFSALHYNSIEEAGLEMLYLMACTKLFNYNSEDTLYKAKYKLSFEEFTKEYEKKNNEENFEEEDDYLAWQFVHENSLFWGKKVEELRNCC